MKNPMTWLILVVLAAAAAWYLSQRQEAAEVERVTVLPPPAAVASEPEPIRFPVQEIDVAPPPVTDIEPEAPPPPPLPSLSESDAEVREALEGMVGAEALDSQWVLEFIISRMVATLDALPSQRVSPQALPLKPVPGKFQVMTAGEVAAVSPQNAMRYQSLVDSLLAVDPDQALAFYVRYYPLFQEAYVSLGYPDAYFNDRLVEVIDHLLETPQPQGVLALVPNEANFDFSDPELQALSSGQKMLLRLGEDNARLVRARLVRLRQALVGLSPTR